jgi:hypothetical protein
MSARYWKCRPTGITRKVSEVGQARGLRRPLRPPSTLPKLRGFEERAGPRAPRRLRACLTA